MDPGTRDVEQAVLLFGKVSLISQASKIMASDNPAKKASSPLYLGLDFSTQKVS